MNQNQVQKPIKRSNLRRKLGREYFCLKRKMDWFLSKEKYSKNQDLQPLNYELINHQSFLLRRLKDVDMYLQHNRFMKNGFSLLDAYCQVNWLCQLKGVVVT